MYPHRCSIAAPFLNHQISRKDTITENLFPTGLEIGPYYGVRGFLFWDDVPDDTGPSTVASYARRFSLTFGFSMLQGSVNLVLLGGAKRLAQ